MGPDHNDVAIGNAGLVQIPGQGVGRLVDLAIGEPALGSRRRLGLDYASAVGMGLGLGAEVLLDRAYIARPVQVDGRVGKLSHWEGYVRRLASPWVRYYGLNVLMGGCFDIEEFFFFRSWMDGCWGGVTQFHPAAIAGLALSSAPTTAQAHRRATVAVML